MQKYIMDLVNMSNSSTWNIKTSIFYITIDIVKCHFSSDTLNIGKQQENTISVRNTKQKKYTKSLIAYIDLLYKSLDSIKFSNLSIVKLLNNYSLKDILSLNIKEV